MFIKTSREYILTQINEESQWVIYYRYSPAIKNYWVQPVRHKIKVRNRFTV